MKTRTVNEVLREMTVYELISHTVDPCEGCDAESCGRFPKQLSCGYYETDDGIQFGPAQVKKEMEKRYETLKRILKK